MRKRNDLHRRVHSTSGLGSGPCVERVDEEADGGVLIRDVVLDHVVEGLGHVEGA